MRILALAPWLGMGGAERQLALLAAGLHARGHAVRVVALNEGGHRVAELETAGVGVEVLGLRGPLDLAPALRSEALRRFRPDAVLSAGVNGLFIGHLVARAAGARHVYNEHRPVGVALSPRRRALLRVGARPLDAVIVVSADQRPEWIARGLAPEDVHTIPNGIVADAPASEREPARSELGVASEETVALCVARLQPEKRVGDFLAAVGAARTRVPGLVGLVAGEGPERAPLTAQLEAAGGERAAGVRLLGLRDDVPRLMRAADVFVLPSDREAMPMAILEAMACALPVLATPVGAVPEVVEEEVSGLLVRPGDVRALTDALVRLATDPDLRARLGAAGEREVATRWSAATMVDAYERVLLGR